MAARSILRSKLCAHCKKTIWRKPSAFSTGAKGSLAGLVFCNRECQKQKFRGTIVCCWPECRESRLIEGANFRRKAARDWFCDLHTKKMEMATGSRKVTGRKVKFVGGEPIDHNRLTWTFIKFFIFERDCGKCRSCRCELNFAARPIAFHIDHIVPVWQGGATSSANLQLLCVACHKAKSAVEQRAVNVTRWSKREGAHSHRMTHFEKDQLIARLQARISDLEGRKQNASISTAVARQSRLLA
jgi:5-methylcytosine-specific restriction endonuclease McrA